LPGHTIKNLMEIVDSGPDGSGVEARFARKHIDSEYLGVSYFRYGPGARLPFGHSHGEQEEAFVVVSGSGRIKLDDEIVELHLWDVVRVAPEVVRGFEGGPDGLVVVAVGSARPAEGDGIKVDDWWTD
jgi:quercetin dioxygenase-like cupin family protein